MEEKVSILAKSLALQVFVLFMSIFVFFYRVCTLLFEPLRFYVIYSGIHHSKVHSRGGTIPDSDPALESDFNSFWDLG